jgi:cell division protease FtsH
MKNLLKNFALFAFIFLVIAVLVGTYSANQTKPEEVGLEQFVAAVQSGEVKNAYVEHGTEINFTLKDGSEKLVRKETSDSVPALLSDYGVGADQIRALPLEVKKEGGFAFWVGALIPFLLPLLVLGVLLWFMMRQVQGMNNRAMSFGQSGAKEDAEKKDVKTKFKDVAGAKEAKDELQEVVEFLKHPEKFQNMGAKIPKGVLLLGSPGTGKTLLARAVAGEAGVPFFHISGSEFVEMFVGVGASRVRDLFRRAKKSAPCIVFIDEIDAVGRQRGAGLGGSHDEREQTLNQILVEMDGFESNVNVIVMAATNRPDVLDQALLRPGRFDRRVMIDLPDINDREAILKVHAEGKPLSKSVNLRDVASRTPGMSGADLANVLNEAAILATRRSKKEITQEELRESIEKVLLGPERKSKVVSDKEKKITAYHEGGHALIAHLLPNADPVHKISIISRGHAAGYTLKLPLEDKMFHTRSEFVDDLAVMMGGYTAEKLIFNELTTGASNDLEKATKLARRLVTQYGMSELGPRTFGQKEEMVFLGKEIHERRDYSESVAEKIDTEVTKFLKEAQQVAEKLLKDNKDKLEKIAQKLIEVETLEKEEFEALMA